MLFWKLECYRENGGGILRTKTTFQLLECCRGFPGTVLRVLFLKKGRGRRSLFVGGCSLFVVRCSSTDHWSSAALSLSTTARSFAHIFPGFTPGALCFRRLRRLGNTTDHCPL